MADYWGRFRWPGIVSMTGGTYTMSQGVAPGLATLRMNPQLAPFANFGDLVILDGVSGPIYIRGCRLERVRETRGPSGVEWELTIADARWKWRDAGYVKLWANQLDPHGKFIPWTIRSPIELAETCLRALGVNRYKIDLPRGLTQADAVGIQTFLPTGVNFPVSGVNPPIDWFYEPAAPALEQLAETFGCRVVPRWDLDEVWIVQRGNGADLPPGSIASKSPSVSNSPTPDAAMVVGAPTRFQIELPLQAVGEDWDGLYRPINNLSYAPLGNAKVQITNVVGLYKPNVQYYVEVNAGRFSAGVQSGQTDMTAILTSLAGQISAGSAGVCTAAFVAGGGGAAPYIRITGVAAGLAFGVSTSVLYISPAPAFPNNPGNPRWVAVPIQNAAPQGADWSRSYPPLFPGVRATERLTLNKAKELARKTVWRYYQITGQDVSGAGAINVPGLGRLQRQQQAILSDTQCEQVVPQPADFNIRMRDGTPWVQNQYNGYSHDLPAVVYGSVYNGIAKHLWNMSSVKAGLNTGPYDIVQVDFNVDANYQLCRFTDAVYRWEYVTAQQITNVSGVYAANWLYTLTVNGFGVSGGPGQSDMAGVLAQIAAAINASTDPRVRGVVVASVAGGVLVLSAVKLGIPFSVSVSTLYGAAPPAPAAPKWTATNVKGAQISTGRIAEPALRLRCAITVRDAETNALVTYENRIDFPGGTPDGKVVIVEKHDDVQVNVIPTYANDGTIADVGLLEADPINRSNYYLQGIIARFQITGGLTNEYNGLLPIQLDGAIAQITWDVGSSGCKTTASKNYEHNTAQLGYGARRRAEALAAAVRPGGFLGELVGARQSATMPTTFALPPGGP